MKRASWFIFGALVVASSFLCCAARAEGMPQDEQEFVRSAWSFELARLRTANDIAAQELLPKFKDDVHSAADRPFVNWLGSLTDIKVLPDGSAMLAIQLSRFDHPEIAIGMINTSGPIEKDSPLYAVAAGLKVGGQVRFSGHILDNADPQGARRNVVIFDVALDEIRQVKYKLACEESPFAGAPQRCRQTGEEG